ncbi:hypothetical protein [Actinomadura sp. 6N118]|uniref:hypothetical protein n=1 Tax=Actinomadura sp. 6N118 TaxID=3375151 RepID=UPI00379C0003
MNTDRWELDRDAAERLLRGEPGDPGTPAEPLGRLLATATTSAQERELAGEDAAVAAFTAAFATTQLPVKRARRIPLTRILTAKAAALSLAVTAAGGVALAAGTGSLPMGPLDNDPVNTVSPTPRPVSKSPSTQPTGPNASQPPANGGDQPSGLAALCRTYASGNAAHRAALLRSAAYSPLVSAAGGAPKVSGYCTKVLKQNANQGKAKKAQKTKPSKGNSGGNNKDQNNGNGNGDDKGNRGGKDGDDRRKTDPGQPGRDRQHGS